MLRMSNWENDAESVDEELTSFLSGVGAASAPVPETVACEESQDELVLKELISFLSGGGSSAAGVASAPVPETVACEGSSAAIDGKDMVDSVPHVTGVKRRAPDLDPYEGLPDLKAKVEAFTGMTNPSQQAAELRALADYLTSSEPLKVSISYSKASDKTKQRARKVAGTFINEMKYAVGIYDPKEVGDLLLDFVRIDLLKQHSQRTKTEDNTDSEYPIGGVFMQMNEKDQEMFLFLLEVDGDSISQLLLQLCPGNDNRDFRYKTKKRFLNGGRKQRVDARDALLVYNYMHAHMRLDTFGQSRTVGFEENGTAIKHRPHTLSGTLDHIYESDFLTSDEYIAYLACNPTLPIGLSLFKEHARCPCMVQPKFRYCADEIQVGLLEKLSAIRERRKKPPPHLKGKVCACTFCVDFRERKVANPGLLFPETNEHTFLQHIVVCPKIKFPGSEKLVYQQKCMIGECDTCNAFRESPLCCFACPQRFGADVPYKYKRYAIVLTDTNKTKELETITATGSELLNALKSTLGKYLMHHWEYKWLHNCHQADIEACDDSTLVIQTDFSAVVELIAQEKLNSAISGYCQMSCWAVMHSPEELQRDGIKKKHLKCDHVRIVTPGTKGSAKDGDWFCHTVMLAYLIYYYTRTLGRPIRRIILWTDGSPGQYKCRQCFGFEIAVLRILFPEIEVFFFHIL